MVIPPLYMTPSYVEAFVAAEFPTMIESHDVYRDYTIEPPLPTPNHIQAPTLSDALLQIYNPHRDSQALKAHPERFEQLRGNYPLRREEGAYTITLNPESWVLHPL